MLVFARMSVPVPFRPMPPGAKIVLVVDDDPTVRALVATTLSQLFTVYVADSAHRAMQILLQIPAPHLLVTDVAMPAVDGLTFVKSVRSLPKLASTPIIFLSVKGAPMDVVAGLNAGAKFYMTKPFRPEDLLDNAKKATGA
jgi:DNA-binding response OmpR family regulator